VVDTHRPAMNAILHDHRDAAVSVICSTERPVTEFTCLGVKVETNAANSSKPIGVLFDVARSMSLRG